MRHRGNNGRCDTLWTALHTDFESAYWEIPGIAARAGESPRGRFFILSGATDSAQLVPSAFLTYEALKIQGSGFDSPMRHVREKRG